MDRITQSLFDEFRNSNGLGAVSESEAFEHFANYSVLFGELSETLELDDVAVGHDSNIGIDGIAIIVNGTQVTSEEDVDSIVSANRFLDATFVFIQAKTSASFDLGDVGKFLFAVEDFFRDPPALAHSDHTKDLIKIKDHIYSRSSDMSTRNPNVEMFYVCTGKWTQDSTLEARVRSTVDELMHTELFNNANFNGVGATDLQRLYRATKNKSSSKFGFTYRVALPQQVPGVGEAHFGLVGAKEFLNLVVDDNGNIKKSLFYDNVRDFQDFNDVNKDIRGTLQSTDRVLFPLLNNGITIIASTVRPTGNVFHIEDYQIVNGCQTSHVLFHEKARLTDDMYVPIKLISTSDDKVVNKIIKATNFQTEVKPDQLYALSDFQKTLEEFYSTFEKDQRLYYERRSKQYASSPTVEKVRIVTIQQQIRAFVAMFLNEPHRGHYPRSVASNVGKSLFGRNHLPDPYYLSAYAQFKLEYFFRNGSIDKRYKPARYHMLLGARQIAVQKNVPSPTANEMKRYCKELASVFHDDQKLLQVFIDAAKIIDLACDGNSLDRKLTKTIPFTERVKTLLRQSYPVSTT